MHIVHSCILHKQTNGVCNHLYVGLLFDSIAFLKKVDVVKILMNSCLRSYQVKISSDLNLAVGFTIIDAVHASILVVY